MIKIGFCDDDISVLNDLRELLDRYRVERNREIDYTAFRSPLDLLAEIERGARFDILILDVLMPGENGIDAAAEIRNYDSDVKIIFLTLGIHFCMNLIYCFFKNFFVILVRHRPIIVYLYFFLQSIYTFLGWIFISFFFKQSHKFL